MSATAALAQAEPRGDMQLCSASLLGALVIVARHRGLDLSEKQLRRDHRLGPGEPSPERLLQIAAGSGMRGVETRLGFHSI